MIESLLAVVIIAIEFTVAVIATLLSDRERSD